MDHRWIPTAVLVLSVFLPSKSWTQPPTSVDQLTRASHIIFVGRIVQPAASNVKAVKATDSTAVVRVERLLDAPPALRGLTGQEVTINLLPASARGAQQQAVFFTTGVLFGEHLQVQEIGSLPVPADVAALSKQIAAVRTSIAQEALQARVAKAVLIITGKVLEVKAVPRTGPVSEHNPDWALAVVQVTGVLKGRFDGRTVNVYFPQSTDERWLLSPKFHPGEQGIWILHNEPNLGLPEGALTALNPLDFRPLSDKPVITRLLR
jgi:hypothetical protein